MTIKKGKKGNCGRKPLPSGERNEPITLNFKARYFGDPKNLANRKQFRNKLYEHLKKTGFYEDFE